MTAPARAVIVPSRAARAVTLAEMILAVILLGIVAAAAVTVTGSTRSGVDRRAALVELESVRLDAYRAGPNFPSDVTALSTASTPVISGTSDGDAVSAYVPSASVLVLARSAGDGCLVVIDTRVAAPTYAFDADAAATCNAQAAWAVATQVTGTADEPSELFLS